MSFFRNMTSFGEWILEFLATIFLIASGVIGLIVGLADLAGKDLSQFPLVSWFKDPVSLTLLVVAGLACGIGLERFVRFGRINKQLTDISQLATLIPERIITSLNGVEVKPFPDGQQFFDYVLRRVNEAETSIEDVSWAVGAPESTVAADKAYDRYRNAIPKVSARIPYREVISFGSSTEQLEHVISLIEVEKPPYAYALRYYDFVPVKLPPIMQFMIIDRSEILFAYYRAPYLAQQNEIRMAVKNKYIVDLFLDYYEAIWEGAKILKEGPFLDNVKLQELKSHLDSLQ